MSHYFDQQPEVASRPKKKNYRLESLSLSLWTDDGIFSKTGLDIGTEVLLTSLNKEFARLPRHNEPDFMYRCLDLGCGMGVIPCFLHHCFSNIHFTAVDINQRACSLAERNMREQGVTGDVYCRDGCAFLPDCSFDIIVSNPPIRIGKKPLYDLLYSAYTKLKSEGHLYLVVGKKQGAESLLKYLQEFTPNVERIARASGFWVLHLQK